ncbi:hypothetical protein GCM10011352_25360 [Marinobacterium zhoushanense]|uniref:DUF2164 domain-containing protein n=1 Tax=Marinobacterium zhoushanense TaxID=1679163 RepID=A0ABQ1KG47_9GAMM|nr:DUF2164 domain-containing protein [Marinobacterium zhoushanense]GGB98191.1 hypothetical protein GCM10011352_25360 [Marinobacterium zhoushanense]
MSKIEFTKQEQALIVNKIQRYFKQELEQDIGGFDAQFLLDFFAEEIGPYFYNRGLYDAQAVLDQRMENISEAIFELEQVTEFKR